MSTIVTLCTGGGLFEVGAGLRHLWGVESGPDIAGVAEMNGFGVIRVTVQEVDYAALERPWWLHMSPPCTNASQANAHGGESELDIEIARACIRAIEALAPPMVSLENVWGYRKFEAFKKICRALREQGYALDYWHLNAADYGVPQTRKRLFLVASRTGTPRKPAPTHQEAQEDTGQLMFFDALPPWRGWYGAIEGLIPGLPDDEFAPWQVPLLPAEIQTMLIAQGKYDNKLVTVNAGSSAFTVTANGNQSGMRGVLMRNDNQNQEWGKGYRDYREPAVAITAARGLRAFLVDGQTNGNGQTVTVRDGLAPCQTISATQTRRVLRAHAAGRVVRMTDHCLARFQSIPDSYKRPAKVGLSCKVIGNAVPPLMAEALVRANQF